MEKLDFTYLCTKIGNLSGIPIRLFEGSELVFYHSFVRLPKDPMEIYRQEIWNINTHVGYFVTRHFNYYGIINSGKTKLVIGPTRQTENTTQELRELAFRADVPPEDTEDFVNGMRSIIRMPLESVMEMLCTVNYVLNHEKLSLYDIAIYDQDDSSNSAAQHSEDLSGSIPQQNVHNTFELEETLMRMIRTGDTAALQEWIASAPAVRGGTLAAEQLRQIKNTFIVTATLASRAAIRGGMDVDDAFTLSDSFIQECELMNTYARIINLQYQMVRVFTERVERIRHGRHPTKLVMDVANYIQHHLSEPITAEEIAKALYLSRPYLSRKFIAEAGENLTDFIRKEKTEEAKRLLRYTDKAIAAIGVYLGFSSQGHFTRTFKKYTDTTPREYREKYVR